jgi:hypothetical protein
MSSTKSKEQKVPPENVTQRNLNSSGSFGIRTQAEPQSEFRSLWFGQVEACEVLHEKEGTNRPTKNRKCRC